MKRAPALAAAALLRCHPRVLICRLTSILIMRTDPDLAAEQGKTRMAKWPGQGFFEDLRRPDMKGSTASPSVFASILALTPKWGLSQSFKSSVTCAAVRVFQS